MIKHLFCEHSFHRWDFHPHNISLVRHVNASLEAGRIWRIFEKITQKNGGGGTGVCVLAEIQSAQVLACWRKGKERKAWTLTCWRELVQPQCCAGNDAAAFLVSKVNTQLNKRVQTNTDLIFFRVKIDFGADVVNYIKFGSVSTKFAFEPLYELIQWHCKY